MSSTPSFHAKFARFLHANAFILLSGFAFIGLVSGKFCTNPLIDTYLFLV